MIIFHISNKNVEAGWGSEDMTPVPLPATQWPVETARFNGRREGDHNDMAHAIEDSIRKAWPHIAGDTNHEAGKAALQLVIVAENDIPDSTLMMLGEVLEKLGYGNVAFQRPDVLTSLYFRSENDLDGNLDVWTDDADLYLGISHSGNPNGMVRMRIPGAADDPRVDAVAMRIWEYVKDNTIDLRIANEMDRLRATARKFIDSGKPDCEEKILLSDGCSYDYVLERSDINGMHTESSRKIRNQISDFLGENGLADRSKASVVLRGSAASSQFLRLILEDGFVVKSTVTAAERNAMGKLASTLSGRWEDTLAAMSVPKTAEPVAEEKNRETVSKVNRPKVAVIDEIPEYKEEEKIAEVKQGPVKVDLEASVETVKAGFMKKKKILKVRVTSAEIERLKWHSVLCIQEKPLKVVELQNVVKEFGRGDSLPFNLEFELPLKNCPNAKNLKIYFKPGPDEPVGINAAYAVAPVSVEV